MITQSYIYLSSNKLLWLFTFVFPCINTQQHIVLLCDAEKTELSCGARRPRMQFINLDDKDVSHRWSPCPKLGENRALMLHATNKWQKLPAFVSWKANLSLWKANLSSLPLLSGLAEGKECNWFILSRWNGFYWNVDNKSPSAGCMCCVVHGYVLVRVHVCARSRSCIYSFVGEVFIVWWTYLNWSV